MKKAWEIEFDTMKAAKPVLADDTAENWMKYEEAGNAYDEKLKKRWDSVVPGSLAPCQLVVASVQAMANKGYDVSAAEKLLEEGRRYWEAGDMRELNAVTAQINRLLNEAPKDPDSDYWSYSCYDSFEKIVSEVDFSSPYPAYSGDEKDLEERIRGGFAAQLVGSSVGTQMEGYTTANIIEAYGEITGYLKEPETYNDDLTYELAFLDVFQDKGYDVTSEDIALSWAALIPDGYSAEETALDNIRKGIMPPESGVRDNYFSDWIGAQMRTAIHGMVAPGNPALAAELAYRDSVVSHSNNGALGGIFNALLVSFAYVERDVKKILELSVERIPKKSQYYAVVDGALKECQKRQDWRETWRLLEEEYKEYHWIHAYPNAAAEVVALYYGEGDFDKTLNIICQAGKDTDCNAAQILTVLGVIEKEIDSKWTEPLHGTVKTYMRDYKEFTVDELVRMTTQAVARARSNQKRRED